MKPPLNTPLSAGEIRREMRALRSALSAEEISAQSLQITQKVLSLSALSSVQTVLLYRSTQNEVDTAFLIEALMRQGKTLAFPVVKGDSMFAAVATEGFTSGAFGVLEPVGSPIAHVDLAIIPVVACDERKNRVGFGKGYYDRFLSQTPCVKIALCYDFQLLPSLPTHEKDVSMDFVVTPTRIIK